MGRSLAGSCPFQHPSLALNAEITNAILQKPLVYVITSVRCGKNDATSLSSVLRLTPTSICQHSKGLLSLTTGSASLDSHSLTVGKAGRALQV